MIAIGSGLEAQKFALKHDCPLYYSTVSRPKPFEFCETPPLVDYYGLSTRKFHTNYGEIEVGPHKVVIWEFFAFMLGLKGLLPIGGLDASLSITEDQELEVRTEGGLADTVEFDEAYVFEPEQLGNSAIIEDINLKYYQVLDWFKGFSEFDIYFRTESDFAHTSWKYEDMRTKGTLILSQLTEEEIDHAEYTPTFSKFILEEELDCDLRYQERKIYKKHDCTLREMEGVIRKEKCNLPTVASMADRLKHAFYFFYRDGNIPRGHRK